MGVSVYRPLSVLYVFSVCVCLCEIGGGRGVEPSTKFSKRGSFRESHFLEGGCCEKGRTFFQGGGLQFLQKKLTKI